MINAANNFFGGALTINGKIAQNLSTPGFSATAPLAEGLRIAGQEERNAATLIDQLNAAQPSANSPSAVDNLNDDSSNSRSVELNFAAEIADRCASAKKEDQASAKILSDSLISTAQSIKEIFGQEQANAFMSQVLAATDNGIDENRLMNAIDAVFTDMRSGASAQQIFDMLDALNYGLESLFETDDILATRVDAYGLGFALNKFFEKDISFFGTDKVMAEAYGFEFDLEFAPMTIVRPDENGEYWIKINTGRTITASELVGSENMTQTANFLHEKIGNENAASYLKNLSAGSNFMDAMATTISIVAKENGQESAARYVEFLNNNIAPAVSSSTDSMSFKGWTLGRDYAPENVVSDQNGGLTIGHEEMHNMLQSKGHQGIFTSWLDQSSGVSSDREIDLTGLYNQFVNGAVAAAPDNSMVATHISFKKPSGNLVNTIA